MRWVGLDAARARSRGGLEQAKRHPGEGGAGAWRSWWGLIHTGRKSLRSGSTPRRASSRGRGSRRRIARVGDVRWEDDRDKALKSAGPETPGATWTVGLERPVGPVVARWDCDTRVEILFLL